MSKYRHRCELRKLAYVTIHVPGAMKIFISNKCWDDIKLSVMLLVRRYCPPHIVRSSGKE